MDKKKNRKLALLFAVACISIVLNLLTFLIAYPEIFKIDSGCCAHVALAKDFSAYYTAGWRLLHDPSNVYASSALQDGGPVILPQPESFKYLPSFLIFILPYLGFSYENALVLFDATQFALLLPLAFLIYKLLEGKRVLVVSIILVIALLLPFPIPGWGVSASYYWQWAEGQSKVLELFLLAFSIYLAKIGKPTISGIVFGLSFFDPRFALISIPLFITFNNQRGKLALALLVSLATLVVSNIPLVLYPEIGGGFIEMVFSGGLSTPVYPYAYIPFIAIIALSLVCWKDILLAFGRLLGQASKVETTQKKSASSFR